MRTVPARLAHADSQRPVFVSNRRFVAFTFAKNNIVLASAVNSKVGPGDYRQNEWAGANYSPDGQWLFVNIQTPGVTFAITGPWGSGPL